MQKVIFVCLLSLSVCLSQQNPQEGSAPVAPLQAVAAAANTTTIDPKTPTAKPESAQATQTQTATNNATVISPAAPQTQNTTATPNATQLLPASNETSTKTNETKPAEPSNKTDVKPDKETPKPNEEKVDPSKDKNDVKPVVPSPKIENATAADGKDSKKNETTTPKGEVVNTTPAPVQTKSRAFDGPSFIGGMILTLGMLAIGFMGFKYYKNQTERNYHTL